VVKDATLSSSSGSSYGRKSDRHVDMQLDYTKMKSVALEKGLAITDVPVDGDCALHAVISQLQQLRIHHSYDVWILRHLAVQYLESHTELVNFTVVNAFYAGDVRAYLKQQAIPGTLCDENMLHAVANVTKTIIYVLDDSGYVTTFEPIETYRGWIKIGRIADAHYVSLEARDAASSRDTNKWDKLPNMSGESAAPTDRYRSPERDEDNQEASQFSYSKLTSEADRRRLSVVDVERTGDSALHAVVHQLSLQDSRLFDVMTLRKRAVDYLYSHTYLINKDYSQVQSYLSAQSVQGTHCDETMLSAVSEVIMKEIHILHDDGRFKKLGKQTSITKPVIIGVYAKVRYVSLELSYSEQKHKTPNDIDKSSQFQNDAALQHTPPSAEPADAGNEKPTAAANDTCAICMDVMKDPKTLVCNHVFCSQCIDQSLAYQPKCPCCGKIFGVLKGDQPEGGSMQVRKEKWLDLEGYPRCGRIVIEYYIPSGRQKVWYNTLYLILSV